VSHVQSNGSVARIPWQKLRSCVRLDAANQKPTLAHMTNNLVRKLFAAALGAVILSCGDSHPTGPDAASAGPSITADAQTSEGAGGPSVTTDKTDYVPGDTVIVSGTGWQPNETISLLLTESPAVHDPTLWNVIADSLGAFVDRSFAIEPSHLGVAFQLIATGAASADTAQGTFTDGGLSAKTNLGSSNLSWERYTNNSCSGSSASSSSTSINSTGSPEEIINPFPAGGSIKAIGLSAPAGTVFVEWTSGVDHVSTVEYCFTGAATWTAVFGYVTVTELSADLSSPQTEGATITFSASVKKSLDNSAIGTGNGSVSIVEGTCEAPTGTIAADLALPATGIVTASTSALSAGTHSLIACYSGKSASDLLPSSGTLSFTINAASTATATTVTADTNPSVTGESVTYTATVKTSPGDVAVSSLGTVTFRIGGADCSTGTAFSGPIAIDASGEATGSRSFEATETGATIRACYSGATGYDASNGTATQTVNKAATTTDITTDGTPSNFGASVLFTATVSADSPGSGTPTGSVNFYEFTGGQTCALPGVAVALSTQTLSSGSASFSTSTLGSGSHTITACYGGDSNYSESSDAVTQDVNALVTETSISASPTSSAESGESVTFTGTVKLASDHTTQVTVGDMSFHETSCAGTELQAAGALDVNGQGTYTTSGLTVGSHTIVACYEGTSAYEASADDMSYTIDKIATTTTLTSNPGSDQVFGTSITFTAEVNRTNGGTDITSGSVGFYEGTDCTTATELQAPGAVDGNGKKTFTTSTLSVGSHNILACYGGTSTIAASSDDMPYTINKIPTTVTLALTPSSEQQYSDKVHLKATVSPTGVGGSVQFQKKVNAGAYVDIGSPVTVADDSAASDYTIEESSADALSLKAVFTPADTDHYAGDDDSRSITVTNEDAKLAFDAGNPAAKQVDAPGSGNFSTGVTFTITVREKTPDVAAATAAAGDIANAGLAVQLSPVAGGGSISAACASPTATGSGYSKVMTYACSVAPGTNIPLGTYQLDASVTGDYYTGSDTDAFTVFDPTLGFATGGGTFILNGDRVNFGFTMKYNKSGANLQGNLIAVRHHSDGTVSRIKSNSLGGLALSDLSGCGIAQFSGKATYTTWSSSIDDYVNSGNNSFTVYAKDCNNPGTGLDYIWIDGPGNLDMPMPATDNLKALTGGNIAVPHKPGR
jgi:hypothetical protein